MQYQVPTQSAAEGHVSKELDLRQCQKGRFRKISPRPASLEAAARNQKGRDRKRKSDNEAQSSRKIIQINSVSNR